MSNIPIPSILDAVARSGIDGVAARDLPDWEGVLSLCRRYKIPLEFHNSRYFLKSDPDTLLPFWIEAETPAISWDSLRVFGYFRIGSTNEEAIERARKGETRAILIYSEEQTAGRGRNGKTWVSRPSAGLYFSLMLLPERPMAEWPLLTHVAGIALADTVKDCIALGGSGTSLTPEIKWPNDLLLLGKKTAGILLETARSSKSVNHAVVGVGINVRAGAVPEPLAESATSLERVFERDVPRRELLVRFLFHFQTKYELFSRGDHSEILRQWKCHSRMWNGALIRIRDGEREKEAVTCGLSSLGALLVRLPDGTQETILAGDVSVRTEQFGEEGFS